MAIILNHTIVPAYNKEASARFFARIVFSAGVVLAEGLLELADYSKSLELII